MPLVRDWLAQSGEVIRGWSNSPFSSTAAAHGWYRPNDVIHNPQWTEQHHRRQQWPARAQGDTEAKVPCTRSGHMQGVPGPGWPRGCLHRQGRGWLAEWLHTSNPGSHEFTVLGISGGHWPQPPLEAKGKNQLWIVPHGAATDREGRRKTL